MPRAKYKQKPQFWYCCQYTGSNAAEVIEFCPLVTQDGQKLMFAGVSEIAPTSWVTQDSSGRFSLMDDAQFIAFFQLDMGGVLEA